MLLTEDQKFFLTILRETSCVRADHVLPLLHLQFPDKTQYQADAMLRTLRTRGKSFPVRTTSSVWPSAGPHRPAAMCCWAWTFSWHSSQAAAPTLCQQGAISPLLSDSTEG